MSKSERRTIMWTGEKNMISKLGEGARLVDRAVSSFVHNCSTYAQLTYLYVRSIGGRNEEEGTWIISWVLSIHLFQSTSLQCIL